MNAGRERLRRCWFRFAGLLAEGGNEQRPVDEVVLAESAVDVPGVAGSELLMADLVRIGCCLFAQRLLVLRLNPRRNFAGPTLHVCFPQLLVAGVVCGTLSVLRRDRLELLLEQLDCVPGFLQVEVTRGDLRLQLLVLLGGSPQAFLERGHRDGLRLVLRVLPLAAVATFTGFLGLPFGLSCGVLAVGLLGDRGGGSVVDSGRDPKGLGAGEHALLGGLGCG